VRKGGGGKRLHCDDQSEGGKGKAKAGKIIMKRGELRETSLADKQKRRKFRCSGLRVIAFFQVI